MSHRRSTLGNADPNTLQTASSSGLPVPVSARKPQSYIGTGGSGVASSMSGAAAGANPYGPPVSSQHNAALRASRASLAPMRSQGGPLSSQSGTASGSASTGAGGGGPSGSNASAGAGLGSSTLGGGGSIRYYPEEALTTPRVGTSLRGLGASNLRTSTASGGGGRQSLAVQSTPNQQRVFGRQSVAHASFRPEAPAMKDPRPLRNAAFRAGMEANVKDFVEKTGFTMPGWTNKTIHEPSQAAFVNMFRHVYSNCVDPNYQFGSEAKKFEEEVIMLMKDVKYPFVDDLSKTRLFSAGSQQNWPICLGMLDWLVRLGMHAADIGCGPLQREDEDESEIFYRYLWRCYAKFWQNEDTFPEEYDELREIYDEKMEGLRREEAELENEIEKLDAELQELDGESPLEFERREDEVLKRDIVKFTKYNDDVLMPKLDRTAKNNERLKESLIDAAESLKEKEKERGVLQQQVDAQEMSAEEFERLSGERAHIQKQLQDIIGQMKVVTKTSWDIELENQNRQRAVESLMSSFNQIGDRVKFLPLTMSGSSSSSRNRTGRKSRTEEMRTNNGSEDEESELDKLELVVANEDTLLPKGVDIRRGIKPAIQALRQATNVTFQKVTEDKIAAEDDEENLVEKLTAVEAERRLEQNRLVMLKDQIDELTSSSKVEMDMLAEDVARKERQLGMVETAGRVALQEANMTYDAMVDELETARYKIEENKQRLLTDVANALGELDRLQQRVHEGIERIEEAVLAIDE
ncbi:kinetochore-associated Ndc80 complex subunit ndc80 [Tilletia horrida]|nr:kinetochore-associated Ndc80 complex subunit ndc80 [Tilletia horrida]